VHFDGLTRPSPHLPSLGSKRTLAQLGASIAVHAVLVFAALTFVPPLPAMRRTIETPTRLNMPVTISRLVFIAREARGSGGGGGGNRQPAPIRRAEGVGHDAVTLRVAKPSFVEPREGAAVSSLPGVLLDARPLASGIENILGLPDDGVAFGTSLGPGTGGGVGTGAGTGIGAGTGPGVGAGSGGGTGGGVYRVGGAVSSPRVITQVKPKYTEDALVHKVQGTVVLDMIVTKDGAPAGITLTRSLDPGLDAAAMDAARQWRFEPGRLAGTPVDVLVTLVLDFRIQ
jgi:TonB family protein